MSELWQTMDASDPLAGFRDDFYTREGEIYLDGNSLGLLSGAAERALLSTLEQWKRLGIGGWTDADPPWFFLAESLGSATAPLIGAEPEEVLVTNSTTVNLHQLLATLLAQPTDRSVILTDSLIFPSDAYAIESFIAHRPDLQHLRIASADGYTLHEKDILSAILPDVRLVLLPSVVYTSGQLLPMASIAGAARRAGALIGFDCSHSIGSVPHFLDEWDVDFAFWCGYKYLNGGPGASAGLFLNRRHFGTAPGLAGWFSSRKDIQLAMHPTLSAARDAGALQIGTPNIMSMAPLRGTLETIHSAGIERIREKSLALNAYLQSRISLRLDGLGFKLVTPTEAHRAGGHTALSHPEALRICKALRAKGVVPDFRPPDIIRLAPVALYTRYKDCFDAVEILREIMLTENYREQSGEPGLVP